MQKQEFEERIERTVTDEQYKVIEEVYMWHPSIRNTSGKDEVAELIFMSVMFSMLQTDMEKLSRNRKQHWKNLDLNFQIQKRRDQRQITARLFLILPAGQCF